VSRIPRVLVGPLVCLVVVGVAVAGFFAYRASTGNQVAGDVPGAATVAKAEAAPIDQRVAVAGYVFLDKYTGDLLCSERTRGPRPACKGDVATLDRLDPTRLDLVRAKPGAKGYDAWSRGVVVLEVRTRRVTFVVEDVLPTPSG
jgi:hypothetical protein